MIVLDTTIVNVALPSIRGSLHFSQTSLAWAVVIGSAFAALAAGLAARLLRSGAIDAAAHAVPDGTRCEPARKPALADA
jgi:MFS family permease